jgi:hypothetical protein
MASSTANPRARGALEAVLRLVGPGLDALLAVGERVSGLLERRDDGYAVVRMDLGGRSAPRSLDGYQRRDEAA